MSLYNVFNISGSGMSSQSVRMNAISSNIANAESVSSSVGEVYRAKKPVFQTLMMNHLSGSGDGLSGVHEAGHGVYVSDIVEEEAPTDLRYEPDHPMANEEGYVAYPNINVIAEMTDMISASRGFQNNVEVLNTTRQMMQKVINMGQ